MTTKLERGGGGEGLSGRTTSGGTFFADSRGKELLCLGIISGTKENFQTCQWSIDYSKTRDANLYIETYFAIYVEITLIRTDFLLNKDIRTNH